MKVNIAEAAASAQSGDFRYSSPFHDLGDSPAWTKPVPNRELGQSQMQSPSSLSGRHPGGASGLCHLTTTC